MNTNKIIKSIRGRSLLTQEEMAKRLNISRQAYNVYENDMLHCNLDFIMKILNILNATDMEVNDFLHALKQDYLSYLENNKQCYSNDT